MSAGTQDAGSRPWALTVFPVVQDVAGRLTVSLPGVFIDLPYRSII
jgi:hypothetical protein